MNARRITATAAICSALSLAACEHNPIRNALSHDTPPSTVARVSDFQDHSGIWLLNKVLVTTPTTLTVRTSAPVAGNVQTAITQYESLAGLTRDPRLQAEALQRAADLRLQRADAGEGQADDVSMVIALYRRVLDEHPQHPGNDRVLYQLARAYQLAGQESLATDTLRRLGVDYPQSPRAAEAHFRAGELLYQAHDYAAARVEYEAVVDAGVDGKFHDPAQYKLAWSLFQFHQYGPALPVLLAILDRELPAGTLEDPQIALSRVAPEKAEMTAEALRVTSLCFAALGGGVAVGEQVPKTVTAARMEVLLYTALADQLRARRRYSDAAETYATFIDAHPDHARAPDFQSRIVSIYRDAGFEAQTIAAQTEYAERYAPDSAYWAGRTPDPAVVSALHDNLEALARYERSRAQQSTGEAARVGNLSAAHWFHRLIELYPEDPQYKATRMLYADALLDGGKIDEAAQQYRQLAFGDDAVGFPAAAEAAYAAVQAYGQLVDAATTEQRAAALRDRVQVALALADRYPQVPQVTAILSQTAADQLELGEPEQAIAVAQRALGGKPTPEQQRVALSVIADARFARKEYPEAERAYQFLLAALTDGAQRVNVIEQLAASIYKQGESARAEGDMVAAAEDFLRVGRLAPQASIHAKAQYDAAATLIAAGQWVRAAATLETFRTAFPDNELIPDADRKLAVAYDHADDAAHAASTYARIANRASETLDDRRVAAWRAAHRFDDAKLYAQSAQAYQHYVEAFPQPLEAAVDARQRLVDLAPPGSAEEMRWLQSIVAAERNAGQADSEHVRQRAASAQLRIGRIAANNAASVALILPLDRSLPRRVAATKAAVKALDAAADYGFAETTTAATYELARVYRELGKALLASPRPAHLDALARDQYQILLEEQAYPFEESAIKAYETNLGRIDQGVWNEWVQRSVAALEELVPARYGKHEHREVSYDSPS